MTSCAALLRRVRGDVSTLYRVDCGRPVEGKVYIWILVLRTEFPSYLLSDVSGFSKTVSGFQLRALAATASFTAAILNDRDLRTLTKAAAPSEPGIRDANPTG